MKSIFIPMLLAIPFANLWAQESLTFKQKTQLTAGVSTTDAANLGIRYRLNQSQLWCNIGVGGIGRYNRFFTIGPAFSQHLWGTSKNTDLKPWYVKLAFTGVSYSMQLTRLERETAREVYTKVHLGRDFNITKRAGVTVSVGPSGRVYRKWNRPYERAAKIDLINYASFDLNLYYRLQKI